MNKLALNSYLETMLWSSTYIGHDDDNCGSFLDENYDIDDIAPEFIAESKIDLQDFFDATATLFEGTDYKPEQIAHDFWLTRCGHGAGFWDGDYGDIGDKLTAIAEPYGSIDPMLGNDNLIYG